MNGLAFSTPATVPAGSSTTPSRSALRSRWAYELFYALLVVGAAALILSLVGRRSGWPIGGALFNELTLVPLYAAHFRHLDFFPVWSSTDGLGLGTPVLLYYQKTFFYVSGFLFILFGGDLKPTLILSIAIFLAVGAYGMRQALGLITDSRWLQAIGSLGFLFTNYVFTDWLARGDLPEFSAMMIVPWLLYWCLNLVKNRRVSLLIIPIMVLLVDAHSAIGLLSVFTLTVTAITFLVTAGLAGLRAVAWRLVIAAGGTAILLAPTLLAELRFSQYFDPASKVSRYGQTVSANFVRLPWYFVDTQYRWLDAYNSGHYRFVQIDYSLWMPIAIAVVAVLTHWVLTGRRPDRTPWGRQFHIPCTVLLVVSLCIYLFLQIPVSLFVYRVLSPLQVIDYPYRMLAFITPLCVILVVAIANAVFHAYPTSKIPKGVAVIWLLSLLALSPLTATWKTDAFLDTPANAFPSTMWSAPPAVMDYRTFGGFFSESGFLFPEYLPKVDDAKGDELYGDGPLYKNLHHQQSGAASLSSTPCHVAVPSRSPLESLSLTFRLSCAGPTRVALPVTYNTSSSVFVESNGKLRSIPYYHSPRDPRIIIKVPDSDPQTIVVHLPTLWGILR
jgi:hypothetical protein